MIVVNGQAARAELELGKILSSMSGPNPYGWIGMYCNLNVTTWVDHWTFKCKFSQSTHVRSHIFRSCLCFCLSL
jgi:hypothetical protein